jgi:hypothetical protein
MKLNALQAWLTARPGVLLNLGIGDEPESVFLAWLSWEEDGQQLELPWRVDPHDALAIEEALRGLTREFERRERRR